MSRNCSRCGQELTDAASMNHGVGPICRKMDNAVLARQIPANVAGAMRAFSRIVVSDLPEAAHDTLGAIGADLLNAANNDWRTTCKRVEWVISWNPPKATFAALINLVTELGYVSLAAMLQGESAKGKASVWFENGRLYLVGPRNKCGAASLKAIPGRKFHPAATSSEKARWSVPAAQWQAFQTTVWKHWPVHQGLSEALQAAQADKTPAAAPEAPVAKTSVVEDGSVLKVRTPYNPGFIAELKSLPYKTRKWNPAEKVWEVDASKKAEVASLIQKYYGETLSVQAAA